MYKTRKLSAYAYGRDRLACLRVLGHPGLPPTRCRHALRLAFSLPVKGVIPCDEGSLGKTYEARLSVTQLWYEGKDNILLVVPVPLLGQWATFWKTASPCRTVMDSAAAFDQHTAAAFENLFAQDGYVQTTYDFAAENAARLAHIPWDVVVFEEAHHLRRAMEQSAGASSASRYVGSFWSTPGADKTAAALRDAVDDASKILLTATPCKIPAWTCTALTTSLMIPYSTTKISSTSAI